MAIEKINSAFDTPALKQEFKAFVEGMEESQAAVVNLFNAIKSYKGANLKTVADQTIQLDSATKKAISSTDKLNASREKAERLIQQQIKTEQQVVKLIEQEDKALAQNNKTKESASRLEVTLAKNKSALTKVIDKEKASLDKLDNAYEQLKKQYNDASNLSKRRGAELLQIANGNEKVYKSMLGQDEVYQATTAAAQKYYKQLELLETEVGQHQRKVGQYATANWGLSNSINQLTRELPAFANSLNTGFMAISNNLPMFADEIKKINVQNKELAASGQKPVSVLKQLGGAFFSWGTALSLGVTLLTVYGGKIVEWVSNLFKGQDAIDKMGESQELLNKALSGSSSEYAKVVENVDDLTEKIKLAKEGLISKEGTLKLYNETIGKTTGQVKTLDEAEQALAKNGEAYIKMTLYKAAANLALEEAAKAAMQAEVDRMKKEQEFQSVKTNARSFSSGGSMAPGFVPGMNNVDAGIAARSAEAKKEKASVVKASEDREKTFEDIANGFQKKAAEISSKYKFDFYGSLGDDDKKGEKEKAAKDNVDKAKSYYEEMLKSMAEANTTQLEMQSKQMERVSEDEKQHLDERVHAVQAYAIVRNRILDIGQNEELHELEVQRQAIVDEYAKRIEDAKGNKKQIAQIKAEEAKELTSFDEYAAAERKKIDVDYQQKRVELAYEAAGKILKIQSDLNKDLKDLYKESEKNFKDSLDRMVDNLFNANKKKPKPKEEEDERLKKLKELETATQNWGEMVNNTFAAAGEIINIGLDKKKVAIEELEAKQQEAYENEVKRINASSATEEEKANKLKILEAERQAQKQENDRKARKIEIDRAKFQKATDIANIVTSTSVAVLKALQTQPTALGIALAATVGALGAAQLAKAIAVPLPKYEKGTQSAKGGWAITDEKGPEMYIEPGGKTFMGSNAGPTLRHLKPGTKIIPADEINQRMHNAMMAETARRLAMAKQQGQEDPTLTRIEDAILSGTAATIREMRRQRKSTTINNRIDLGWADYYQKKTFNS